MIKKNDGFTLIELILVIGILGLVLGLITDMYLTLLNQYKQQGKIAETNIEGVIGLELLRQDLERAGTGLPWVIDSATAYSEASAAPASTYNDCSGVIPCNPPRPIMSEKLYTSGWNNGSNYPDLLVIKAANLPRNASSQSWTYLTTAGTHTWDLASENPANNNYVVVLSPGTGNGDERTLITSGGTIAPLYSTLPGSSFQPVSGQPRFVYSIGDNVSLVNPPRMPFNRADYYIVGPGSSLVPSRCAPNTGVLVKSIISQSDGSRSDILPLLDCVADMKVVFRKDNGAGLIPADDINFGMTAAQMRAQVKEARVYILAHEGQKDRNYTYPASSIYVGDTNSSMDGSRGHTVNLGSNLNYRWKLYTIVVQLKNMRQQ